MSAGWFPRAITFGGGGARIIGSMGVLSHLIESGMTTHVTEWYGCSAGAICALFAALGVTSTWLQDLSHIFDTRLIGVIREDYVCDFANIWGAASTDSLKDFLGKIIDTWEAGSSTWTFTDFAQKFPHTGLHISATNVSQGVLTIFNSKNSPRLRIIDAVCASSTFPFFFAPWVHPESGDIYCDGGAMGIFPWSCIPNKDQALAIVCSDRDIIGRALRPAATQTMTIVDYFTRILALISRRETTMGPKYWIAVNNRTLHSLDFHITKEEQLAAFDEGVRTAKGWMTFRASMLLDYPARTLGPLPPHGDPCTLSSSHPSLGKTSDIHQSHIPLLPHCPPRDSHIGRLPRVRRWSL